MKNLFFAFLLSLVLSSCASRKDIVYLNDIPQTDTLYAQVQNQMQHAIQFRPGDKLNITITARNKELTELFNQTAHQNGSSRGASIYTVDPMGEIDFPFLGKIRIAGLDRMQTEEYIKQKLIDSELIREPYVSVDYGNVGFYTLGELGGRFVPFESDQTTILEAIARAGDLSLNGVRKNLLVIRRNVDGSENTYRVDLTSREQVYNSPAYYIQQNDILYVEPNFKQLQSTTINGTQFNTYHVWISLLSTAMTLFLFVQNLTK